MNIPAEVSNTADNFNNLLELPIIFYAVCLIASMYNLTTSWLIIFAWGYVLLRICIVSFSVRTIESCIASRRIFYPVFFVGLGCYECIADFGYLNIAYQRLEWR